MNRHELARKLWRHAELSEQAAFMVERHGAVEAAVVDEHKRSCEELTPELADRSDEE